MLKALCAPAGFVTSGGEEEEEVSLKCMKVINGFDAAKAGPTHFRFVNCFARLTCGGVSMIVEVQVLQVHVHVHVHVHLHV